MFTIDPQSPPEAISAVKALNIANAQGQRIYEITPANQAIVLNQINYDNATMEEIRASLTVGKTIITHTDPVSVPGYSGAGYIILDPETGEGVYKISGSLNGSECTIKDCLGFDAGVEVMTITAISLLALFAGPLGLIVAAILNILIITISTFITYLRIEYIISDLDERERRLNLLKAAFVSSVAIEAFGPYVKGARAFVTMAFGSLYSVTLQQFANP